MVSGFDIQNTYLLWIEDSCKFDIGTLFSRWPLKGCSTLQTVQRTFSWTKYQIASCRTHLICVCFSIGIRLELYFFLFFVLPPRDFPHYREYVHFHHIHRSNTQLEVALKCMATYIIHICTVWVLGLHLKGHEVSASNFWPWLYFVWHSAQAKADLGQPEPILTV